MTTNLGLVNEESSIDPVKESIDREKKFNPEKTGIPLSTWEPIVGGIIVIVLSVLVIVDALANYNTDVHDFWMIPFELSFTDYQLIVIASTGIAVVAVMGGAMSVYRRYYHISVMASILGAAVGWLWYNWFGLAIGLVGIMLISFSSEQFDKMKDNGSLRDYFVSMNEQE